MLKQLCEELHCNLIRQAGRNAKQIKLINRDVRLHPRLSGYTIG